MATSDTEQVTTVRRPGGRSARVRRAVFDATLELLAQGGYQALSVEAVAEAAGVNKTTIYRNWPTKAELVRTAAADRSANVIDTRSTGDLEADLTRMLTSVADYITSPVGRALVTAALNGGDDGATRRAQADFWKVRFDAARAVIGPALEGTGSSADDLIEHLISPVFLRAFITRAPIDGEFIEKTVRTGLRMAASRDKRTPGGV